ncbi:MAG: hypothetical protein SXU28_12960 [Pseudomonadota bacterium]|nr:hypothetical protein [Pseudomonadota bacterium]
MARILNRHAMIFVALFALHFGTAPAKADWHEASSDNFVIYADDREKDIRVFAQNLERFHKAMEFVTGRRVEKPSPSNRVVIFVAGSQKDIRKLSGRNSRTVQGFYIPRAGGSKAFVQDIRNKDGYPHFSTIILLHEYAHHFLISASRYEMPRWLSEGAAEFFAAATFNRDGSVTIGRPAVHRRNELNYAAEVSVAELLDHELYKRNKGRKYDAFYGRSWLLYHYLTFTPEREGQLVGYAREVFNGAAPLAAGKKVFGDLDVLEDQLDDYLGNRKFGAYKLEPEQLPIGEITVRRMSEGEAEIMPLRMRSQRGVNLDQAKELLPEVRKVAGQFPDDAYVLAALSEAEYDAGNNDEAIAAADRAIAINPRLTNPYVQKGYALFRMARDAEGDDRDAAFKRAMKPFQALNKIENDHPMPLIYYYRSFAYRGVVPPENARHALERAAQLAPFDKTLWLNVAMVQMREGKIALAKQSLQPLAFDPHGGSRSNRARSILAMLEKTPEGTKLTGRDIRASQTISVAPPVAADDGE